MDLPKCITDDIKTYNNDNMGMKSASLCLIDFSLFFTFLLIFMNTQIMQIR